MTKSADIIDSFREQGVPSRLTGPWAGQPCDPEFFDLPEDQEGLLQRLRERFALRDLIKCGIVRSESDERVTLSPRVTENHLYLCPLMKSAGKRPFDLLMGAGGTLTGECSLLAALDDRNFAVAAECDGGRVFVSEFAEDVAILHSLELPAAPARDLACLVGERLEVFCQKLHLVPAPTEAGEEKRRGRTKKLRIAEPPLPMSVVIVNWRLGQLTREDIPSALGLQRYFLTLAERLGIPCDDFALWKPSESRLERLRFALECGSQEQIRQAVLEDLENDCVRLDCWPPADSAKPPTLAESLLSVGTRRDDGLLAPKRPNVEEINQQVQAAVIRPLLEEAAVSEEPVERNLLATLAGLSRMFHENVWTGDRGAGATPDRVQLGVALAKQIGTLSKECKSWR